MSQCPCIALWSGLNSWMFNVCLFQPLRPVLTRFLIIKVTVLRVLLSLSTSKLVSTNRIFGSGINHQTMGVAATSNNGAHPVQADILVNTDSSGARLHGNQPHQWWPLLLCQLGSHCLQQRGKKAVKPSNSHLGAEQLRWQVAMGANTRFKRQA